MRTFAALRGSGGPRKTLARLFSAAESTGSDKKKVSCDIGSKQLEGRSIYMDLGATTPLDFRVLDTMMPYMTDMYGNPHSRYLALYADRITTDGRAKKR